MMKIVVTILKCFKQLKTQLRLRNIFYESPTKRNKYFHPTCLSLEVVDFLKSATEFIELICC